MEPVTLPSDADRAVKDFLATADPELVHRFVAGELTLAFIEISPVVRALAGCTIEEAYARLKAMTAGQLNKYAPTVVKTTMPKGDALIDHILTDLYGRTYRPPPPPKKTTTSRSRSTKSAAPKIVALSPDEAIRQLRTVTTADEAQAILGRMKRLVAEYQRVADSLDVVYPKRPSIAVLTKGIVDVVLAARRFEPLQRGGMR